MIVPKQRLRHPVLHRALRHFTYPCRLSSPPSQAL